MLATLQQGETEKGIALAQEKPLAMFILGDKVEIDLPQESMTLRCCYYRRASHPERSQLNRSE